jgi:ribosomal protein L7/L12
MTTTAIVLGLVVGALSIVLLLAAAALRARDRRVAQLAVIERRLAAIMDHLGVAEPDPDTSDVAAYVAAGKTVDAIKLYREQTGASLLDAKNAVDQLGRRDGT